MGKRGGGVYRIRQGLGGGRRVEWEREGRGKDRRDKGKSIKWKN